MRESGTLLAEKHRERRKKKEKKKKSKRRAKERQGDKKDRKQQRRKGGHGEKKKSMSFNSYQPPVRSQSTYYIIPSKLAYVNIWNLIDFVCSFFCTQRGRGRGREIEMHERDETFNYLKVWSDPW